ncbi:hypothetical protein E4U21_002664 [Claviceps maximensis]|nr:hypothetical protein E4U21_002664 [Claviceps maximensis]
MSCNARNQFKILVDILCLPTEILTKICALFCGHCTDKVARERVGLRYWQILTPARLTLRSLTEVSKRFRSVCLPILLHQMEYAQFHKFLEFRNGHPQIAPNFRGFLVTFACPRPKPSESLKLGSSSSTPPYTEGTNEQSLFQNVDLIGCEGSRIIPDAPNYAPRFEAAFGHFSTFVFENLQSITIGGKLFFEKLPVWDLLNSIIESAPALRTLRLKELILWNAGGDTIDLSSKKNDEDEFVPLSSHKNLRCLMISFGWYGNAEHEFLKSMLVAFECLDKLSILGHIVPSEIVKVIPLRKDTLRVLELQGWKRTSGDCPSSIALSTFIALEKLIMTDCFFHSFDHHINEAHKQRYLVEMIPISVQELILFVGIYDNYTENTIIGLLELGRDISRGRFPSLKQVIIRIDVPQVFGHFEWKMVNDDEDGVELERFIDDYRKGVKAAREAIFLNGLERLKARSNDLFLDVEAIMLRGGNHDR